MSRRHTLVLDLDETLLHSDDATEEALAAFDRKPDYRVPGTSMVGWLRPHLKEFLEYAFDNFDVIVWTAGSKEYADVVVPEAFRRHGVPMPRRVLSADDCVPRLENTGWYCYEKARYKPLPKLWQRGLSHKNTLIVDDRADTASDNIANLILMPAFLRDDDRLRQLQRWLERNDVPRRKNLATLDKTRWWLE